MYVYSDQNFCFLHAADAVLGQGATYVGKRIAHGMYIRNSCAGIPVLYGQWKTAVQCSSRSECMEYS